MEQAEFTQRVAVLAAIEGRAATPSPATGQATGCGDDEIGTVGDEFGVEPHYGGAGGELGGKQLRQLELVDGAPRDLAHGRKVGFGRDANGEADAPLIAPERGW